MIDIEILASDSKSSKLADDNYTKLFAESSDNGDNLYLAFTKTTNVKSNSPLQSLKFESGKPCAFTDRRNMRFVGTPKPVYYELEKVTTRGVCDRLFKSKDGETPPIAVDSRYNRLAELSVRPNEFEI